MADRNWGQVGDIQPELKITKHINEFASGGRRIMHTE